MTPLRIEIIFLPAKSGLMPSSEPWTPMSAKPFISSVTKLAVIWMPFCPAVPKTASYLSSVVDTELLPKFATQMLEPSNVTPNGFLPVA